MSENRPRGVIIIPAYNEEPRIGPILDRLAQENPRDLLVVIDDGSSDRTGDIVLSKGATLIRHPFNLGYGSAIQSGYKFALTTTCSWLVQMDADGQHDPAYIPSLLGPILSNDCDLVVGSRFLTPTQYRMSPLKGIGRKVFGTLAGIFGLHVTDPTSGFQAMNRKVLDLYARDFFPSDYPDVDMLLLAHKEGLRIQETSVEMSKGERDSILHRGLRPVYYVYKMFLSTFAVASSRRRRDPRR